MVAKSYQNFMIAIEPYTINNKEYVKVKLPSGELKQVRWYTEEEYLKYYNTLPSQPSSQKDAYGFKEGYITVFKGDTYPHKDWLKAEGAKYSKLWGWYFEGGANLPIFPNDISAVTLPWDSVGLDNGLLKSESIIAAMVAKLLHEPSESKFVGEIGERIDVTAAVKRAVPLNDYYGTTIYTFEDADKNIYVWKTKPRDFQIGEKVELRGTVKDHNIFREVPQTILTRCIIKES